MPLVTLQHNVPFVSRFPCNACCKCVVAVVLQLEMLSIGVGMADCVGNDLFQKWEEECRLLK